MNEKEERKVEEALRRGNLPIIEFQILPGTEEEKKSNINFLKHQLEALSFNPDSPFTARPINYKEKLILSASQGEIPAIKLLAHAHAHGFQFREFIFEKDLKKSREYFQMLRDKDPQNPESLYNIAATYREEGDIKEWKELCKQAGEQRYIPAMYHYSMDGLKPLFLPEKTTAPYNFLEVRTLLGFLKEISKKDPSFLKKTLKTSEKLVTLVQSLIFLANDKPPEQMLTCLRTLTSCQMKIFNLELHATAYQVSLTSDNQQLKKFAEEERKKAAKNAWNKAKEKNSTAEDKYVLAFCFENGIAFQKNINLAKDWYQKSADQNYEPAKNRLQELSPAEQTEKEEGEKQETKITAST